MISNYYLKLYIQKHVNKRIKEIVNSYYLGYNVEIRYITKNGVHNVTLNLKDIEEFINDEL